MDFGRLASDPYNICALNNHERKDAAVDLAIFLCSNLKKKPIKSLCSVGTLMLDLHEAQQILLSRLRLFHHL